MRPIRYLSAAYGHITSLRRGYAEQRLPGLLFVLEVFLERYPRRAKLL